MCACLLNNPPQLQLHHIWSNTTCWLCHINFFRKTLFSSFFSSIFSFFAYCQTKIMNIIENIKSCGLWVGVKICANTNTVCVWLNVCMCVYTRMRCAAIGRKVHIWACWSCDSGKDCLPVAIEAPLQPNHNSLHPVAVSLFLYLIVHLYLYMPTWVLVEEHEAFTVNSHFLCTTFYLLHKRRSKRAVTSCGDGPIMWK